MTELSKDSYLKSITEAIINTSPIPIDAVNWIEVYHTYAYNEINLEHLTTILENGNYSKLPKPTDKIIFDDITVIRFEDSRNDIYYAIIYDSWALEQFPAILRIYKKK